MDVPAETGYQPTSVFKEEKRDPLVDINLTDSQELWLIQWPIDQAWDFDGQQVSLNLQNDGHLGTFGGSSGKSYEVVNFKSQGPEAMVFLSSASDEAKIAGKISRHVSLIHYPEPSELQKLNKRDLSQSRSSTAATSTKSSLRMATPSSAWPKTSHTKSGYSTPSSRTKSTISGSVGHSKGKRVAEQSKSGGHSSQSSGKGKSDVTTSTGSLGYSDERKSKKKKEK